ncbi:hypothetical protein DEF23_01840 [Marinitenerispora sediminis]|uniref:Uncharacterized protein n=2 Tax=Marinitenerispora sediminis TaxID=1931232 RepID=A0A368T0M2_9ACTN|nr:hypothetical protein DEF24_21185 [Marinitenerispora sediminis]RCV56681.1 hypothetical protein DEF28_03130 [Marinitenerispora sediminis]RCV61673.1 hypothetical protein DEF23_01840 [Marinitenerispora sediminis]
MRTATERNRAVVRLTDMDVKDRNRNAHRSRRADPVGLLLWFVVVTLALLSLVVDHLSGW